MENKTEVKTKGKIIELLPEMTERFQLIQRNTEVWLFYRGLVIHFKICFSSCKSRVCVSMRGQYLLKWWQYAGRSPETFVICCWYNKLWNRLRYIYFDCDSILLGHRAKKENHCTAKFVQCNGFNTALHRSLVVLQLIWFLLFCFIFMMVPFFFFSRKYWVKKKSKIFLLPTKTSTFTGVQQQQADRTLDILCLCRKLLIFFPPVLGYVYMIIWLVLVLPFAGPHELTIL